MKLKKGGIFIYIALLIYITLIALFLYKRKEQDKAVKILAFLSFLAIGILVAYRDLSVGSDTENYYRLYHTLNTVLKDTSDIEIGYVYLVRFLNMFSDDPQTLFKFQGILVGISHYYFIAKNTKTVRDAYTGILAFLAFNLFSFHLSGVRQSIAMCICLYAYEAIKKKKIIRFLLLVYIATLFHASAMFFIPAYFVAHMKDNNAQIFSIIFTFFGIFFMEKIMAFFSLINDRFAKYGVEDANNGYIFFAVVTVILIFDIVFRKTIEKKGEHDPVQSKINYISTGMWLMRLFTRVVERISLFYMPATMLTLVHTSASAQGEDDKQIYTIILSALLIILFLYRIRTIPYSFC